ncbi:MAG: SDR family oxidoreductase [Chitinivibrionales bacterium]
MPLNLLITGASGMLGYNLCRIASVEHSVTGVYYSNEIHIDSVEMIKADLTDQRSVKNLVSDRRFDAVIHTAAFSSPGYCQQNPEETAMLNVDTVKSFCRACRRSGTGFVFTSSDLVFNGKNPPYKEDATLSPVNAYGEQKAEAERIVKKASKDFTVCRMPLLFGDPSPCSNSFIQHLIHSLRATRSIVLFTDEYRTPVSAVSAGYGLLMAAEGRLGGGTVHLGGRTRISRYMIGVKLAELMGCDTTLVKGNLQRDKTFAAPRPPDVSLDSSYAYGKGFGVPELTQDLLRLRCVLEETLDYNRASGDCAE